MAKRISMRDYQAALSERLKSAALVAATNTALGVAVGDERWLVAMQDVSEVLPVPELTPVPLTDYWFRGVANVRGNLYSITDFSAFLGGARTPPGLDTRMLLAGQRLGINSGLLVKRMLGIKNMADFEPVEADPESTASHLHLWVAGTYKDAQGAKWHELNLRELVRDDRFLQIAG